MPENQNPAVTISDEAKLSQFRYKHDLRLVKDLETMCDACNRFHDGEVYYYRIAENGTELSLESELLDYDEHYDKYQGNNIKRFQWVPLNKVLSESQSKADMQVHFHQHLLTRAIDLRSEVDEIVAKYKFAGYGTYQKYLNSRHWGEVREAALERAGNRCMLCNTNEGPFHVHHRTYERLGNEEPEDVIVLCAAHHAQFHGKGGAE